VIRRLSRNLDQRLGLARFANAAVNRVFPDHWSFMIGEIALYCFVILVLTGVFLTFFFEPSSRTVVYDGPYAPLQGVEMSAAYRSALQLSFEVRAGLVMRQIHHWAALVFVAAIVVHLMRVFFTAGFRRPRELNWVVGVTLLILAIANGFFGYSLLDDLLSGTGVRVAYAIALSPPVIGPALAFGFFGGEFPDPAIIPRFFVLHVLLLPALIVGLLSLHLAMVWRQKHTQFRGPGRTETNIVGSRLWPSYALKSTALFVLVAAVLCALGGLAQINPVWIYGPFRTALATAAVSSASQPDWYMGWLDGALRLMPAWEVRAFGFTVPNPFFPGALLPGLTFAGLYVWPFLEARLTRDTAVHHLLDRPRDAPLRTAIGTSVFTFYTVLFLAGSNDILASLLQTAPESITTAFRVLTIVAPLAVFLITVRVCRELRDRARRLSEPPVHRILRTPDGGYRSEHVGPPPHTPPPPSTAGEHPEAPVGG
jgi:ubiquinol-cytochrome c reductase cytochrome b subunit